MEFLDATSKSFAVESMGAEHIKNLAQSLSLEDKEELITEMFFDLPAEAKSRIIDKQLGQSGLVVVMGGSNCAVNTDFCIQIQNAPNVDVAAIIEAAVARRRKDKERER